jgi:hypothetical protein
MFKQTPQERELEDARYRREEIAFLSRLYHRGSGCFGVGKYSAAVKKELNKLKRKYEKL